MREIIIAALIVAAVFVAAMLFSASLDKDVPSWDDINSRLQVVEDCMEMLRPLPAEMEVVNAKVAELEQAKWDMKGGD